mmetsp:Transcript_25382/g.59023  ORF Transcript_25382/g.59023 Transcript_25382/m.59023 type:complete len:308 (-) Transcript_25382:102-1025(-)
MAVASGPPGSARSAGDCCDVVGGCQFLRSRFSFQALGVPFVQVDAVVRLAARLASCAFSPIGQAVKLRVQRIYPVASAVVFASTLGFVAPPVALTKHSWGADIEKIGFWRTAVHLETAVAPAAAGSVRSSHEHMNLWILALHTMSIHRIVLCTDAVRDAGFGCIGNLKKVLEHMRHVIGRGRQPTTSLPLIQAIVAAKVAACPSPKDWNYDRQLQSPLDIGLFFGHPRRNIFCLEAPRASSLRSLRVQFEGDGVIIVDAPIEDRQGIKLEFCNLGVAAGSLSRSRVENVIDKGVSYVASWWALQGPC